MHKTMHKIKPNKVPAKEQWQETNY